MGSDASGNIGFNPIKQLGALMRRGAATTGLTDPKTFLTQTPQARKAFAALGKDVVEVGGTTANLPSQVLQQFQRKASVNIVQLLGGKGPDNQSAIAKQAMELYKLAGLGEMEGSDQGDALGKILSPLEKLKEYFTPQKTADRIVNFALSRYGYGRFAGPDTSENRQAYVDYILPAVEKGYDDALTNFGGLPEEVMSEVHSTLELIHDSFDEFLMGADQGIGGDASPEVS